MGGIVRLDRMPRKCNECPFVNKERTFCRLRNSSLIAGKKRNIRMPLCPIMSEGEYLTKQLLLLKHKKGRRIINREFK